jgi:hypothetical protein
LQKSALETAVRNNLRIWGSGVRISSGAPALSCIQALHFADEVWGGFFIKSANLAVPLIKPEWK